jgi:hypothetical protein
MPARHLESLSQPDSPLAAVPRQFDAYNARDVDALVAISDRIPESNLHDVFLNRKRGRRSRH